MTRFLRGLREYIPASTKMQTVTESFEKMSANPMVGWLTNFNFLVFSNGLGIFLIGHFLKFSGTRRLWFLCRKKCGFNEENLPKWLSGLAKKAVYGDFTRSFFVVE